MSSTAQDMEKKIKDTEQKEKVHLIRVMVEERMWFSALTNAFIGVLVCANLYQTVSQIMFVAGGTQSPSLNVTTTLIVTITVRELYSTLSNIHLDFDNHICSLEELDATDFT